MSLQHRPQVHLIRSLDWSRIHIDPNSFIINCIYNSFLLLLMNEMKNIIVGAVSAGCNDAKKSHLLDDSIDPFCFHA